MDNILHRIELEDYIIFKDHQYDPLDRKKYREFHADLLNEGKILSKFDEMRWDCWNGVAHFTIDFSFDHAAYETHMGKKFNISTITMIDMLKCYALYICGEFIFRTIGERINGIKALLTRYGENDLIFKNIELSGIQDFLVYIGTPEHKVMEIIKWLNVQEVPTASSRELANIINYFAIDNEISKMYFGDIDEEEFLRWFPIFFWAKITFIVPLRATEMMVTPFDCIEHKSDHVLFKFRNSKLKKGRWNVCYDVDGDYMIFNRPLPYNETIRVIEKYQKLTKNHKRLFLFDYGKGQKNGMFSLHSFNILLAEFVNEKLIGNAKYDYAKFAAGIREFEVVSAGDSRPLALSNMIYQGVNEDICRQLANHANLSTTAGYYNNVSNTIMASSIMKMQDMINQGYEKHAEYQKIYGKALAVPGYSECSSLYRPKETGDISDCVSEDCLEDCFGCRYYIPSVLEVEEELRKRKEKLDKSSKTFFLCLEQDMKVQGMDIDKILHDAYSGAVRYKIACDEKAKEEEVRWRRHQVTVTTF